MEKEYIKRMLDKFVLELSADGGNVIKDEDSIELFMETLKDGDD